jgi:hypothetical protein
MLVVLLINASHPMRQDIFAVGSVPSDNVSKLFGELADHVPMVILCPSLPSSVRGQTQLVVLAAHSAVLSSLIPDRELTAYSAARAADACKTANRPQKRRV